MEKIKTFNMRVPHETWLFLKKMSAERECSMMEIVVGCVNKYKKNHEKRLTENGADV